jgi:hypothetical protein
MDAGGRLIDAGGHPAARLAGPRAQATVYLPDPGTGYYRGPRFDWSGMMASLRLDGHEVFGEWKEGPRDPLGNDFAVGPAGEFGMGPDTDNPSPIGYDDAPVGGTFLKIGAGERRKTDDGPYHFGHAYPLVSAPRWRIRWGASWMACREEAATAAGWGYRFTKRIEIDDTGPAMTIRHALENTGDRGFHQTWYCHNFIRIDGQPIGTGYRLEFRFPPRLARTVGEAVEVHGNAMPYCATRATDGMFAVVEGMADPATTRSRYADQVACALRECIGESVTCSPMGRDMSSCSGTDLGPAPSLGGPVRAGALSPAPRRRSRQWWPRPRPRRPSPRRSAPPRRSD